MKVPKLKKSNCVHCKKHTEHKVATGKTGGKRGALKRGSLQRAKKRGLGIGCGNLGNMVQRVHKAHGKDMVLKPAKKKT